MKSETPKTNSNTGSECISSFWWLRLSSPLYFDRWMLLLFCIIYCSVSYILNPVFDSRNLFGSSGAVVTLAGLLLNIKHGQYFHRKIDLKSKYDQFVGNGGYASAYFPVKHQLVIKNVILDEVFGCALMFLGTLIWAYF